MCSFLFSYNASSSSRCPRDFLSTGNLWLPLQGSGITGLGRGSAAISMAVGRRTGSSGAPTAMDRMATLALPGLTDCQWTLPSPCISPLSYRNNPSLWAIGTAHNTTLRYNIDMSYVCIRYELCMHTIWVMYAFILILNRTTQNKYNRKLFELCIQPCWRIQALYKSRTFVFDSLQIWYVGRAAWLSGDVRTFAVRLLYALRHEEKLILGAPLAQSGCRYGIESKS